MANEEELHLDVIFEAIIRCYDRADFVTNRRHMELHLIDNFFMTEQVCHEEFKFFSFDKISKTGSTEVCLNIVTKDARYHKMAEIWRGISIKCAYVRFDLPLSLSSSIIKSVDYINFRIDQKYPINHPSMKKFRLMLMMGDL